MSASDKRSYEFGSFRLDAVEYTLLRDGQSIPVTPKVFQTLLVLVENSGHVVEKDELYKQIWQDAFVEETNLTKNISILRKILSEGDAEISYIETVPKRGYRFVVPVRKSASETSGEGAKPGITGLPKPRFDKRLIAAPFLLAVIVLGGFLGYRYFGSGEKQNESIAVMPFVNESGNAELEYLSDGMTETLISRLSQLQNLNVKPRSSVFRYKGKPADAQTIGKELGVQAVLNGRVVQRGDDLLIFVELVDVVMDKVVWSQQYNRKMTDLVALQTEIARDVSGNLRIKLTAVDEQKLLKTYTSNPEAYQLYLRGRHEWNKFSLEGLTRSISFFERAIQIDPDYALAYSGLADSYVNLGADYLSPKETMPKAKAAALQAISLDDSVAEAHSSLGSYKMFFEWDTSGAEQEFKKAIALDPNYANARHFYSHCLQFSGRETEAIRQMKTAVELEPLSAVNNAELGWAYYLARQYDASIEQAQITLELEPGFAYAYFVSGLAYSSKGMYSEARTSLEKGLALTPDWLELQGLLAYARASAGDREEAQALLTKALKTSEGEYINEVVVASVYTALGDNDQAIAWLERGYQARCSWMKWISIEPHLDKLRPDPRFQDLVRRVGS